MDEDQFWQIIESFDWSKQGDGRAVMQPAVDALAKLTIADLHDFDEILAQKLYALDAEKYAASTGFGKTHYSVDSFLYLRCCVVANGRAFYERILNDPSQMITDGYCESVLYLTSRAGHAIDSGYEHFTFTRVSYETFSNRDGWRGADFPEDLPPGHRPRPD